MSWFLYEDCMLFSNVVMFISQFYVTESALELYARDMLLMMIALELQKNMGLQGKTFEMEN